MEWDLKADLWNQAEFEKRVVCPTGRSKALRAKHTSLFEDEPEQPGCSEPSAEENPGYKMIRGRPVKMYTGDTRPGHPRFETQKAIREVSGLGFSNELIESAIKTSNGPSQAISSPARMPDLSFAPRSSKNGEGLPDHLLMEDTPKELDLSSDKDFPALAPKKKMKS